MAHISCVHHHMDFRLSHEIFIALLTFVPCFCQYVVTNEGGLNKHHAQHHLPAPDATSNHLNISCFTNTLGRPAVGRPAVLARSLVVEPVA